jgi:hypothetical protein
MLVKDALEIVLPGKIIEVPLLRRETNKHLANVMPVISYRLMLLAVE